jgi:hypothetical protein
MNGPLNDDGVWHPTQMEKRHSFAAISLRDSRKVTGLTLETDGEGALKDRAVASLARHADVGNGSDDPLTHRPQRRQMTELERGACP